MNTMERLKVMLTGKKGAVQAKGNALPDKAINGTNKQSYLPPRQAPFQIKGNRLDDAEDVAEAKAGKPPSAKEEMLEDAKGRPMRLRIRTNPFKKR